MNRRNFLMGAGALTASDLLPRESRWASLLQQQLSATEFSGEDDFWAIVRESYSISSNFINLNNGGVSPQPKPVQDAHIRKYQYCNEGPSYYMWRLLDKEREPLRRRLAELCGVSQEEIAINRNATEGLNTIIFGLNLKAGDEIVLSKTDYPNMMNAWKQREKRDGVKLVWIDIPQPTEDDAAIVRLYENAITEKTRIVHITHLINWTGNLVPCKAIADMAHRKGCEVIVDAAHSFAHVDFKFPDTGADYLATALHKWLGAPFGNGLLYIKKEKIRNVWALLSAVEPDSDNIIKFESLGTRSFASEMAIGAAIDFHTMIGGERKEARLRFLKDYWTEKAAKLPGIRFYTSLKPAYSCAMATFGFEGREGASIERHLLDKYNIHCTTVAYNGMQGVRISPNVYTSLKELDLLVSALKEFSEMKR